MTIITEGVSQHMADGKQLAVAKKLHIGRYLAAALILALLAWIVLAFISGQIQWSVVSQYLFSTIILRGMVNTVILTVLSMTMGVILGLVCALMTNSANPVLRYSATGYKFFFRAVPILLQLLIWYNLALIFPTISLFGIETYRTTEVITPFVASLLAFGIAQGAYTSEVIRSGLLAVNKGQTEAAMSIGMTKSLTLRRIVIPQAMRVIVPPLGNETIGMLKYTSLASIIQYPDIVYSSQSVYYANGLVIELLMVCAFWYLTAVAILSLVQSKIEIHYNRSANTKRATGEEAQ